VSSVPSGGTGHPGPVVGSLSSPTLTAQPIPQAFSLDDSRAILPRMASYQQPDLGTTALLDPTTPVIMATDLIRMLERLSDEHLFVVKNAVRLEEMRRLDIAHPSRS
jgi:hypothetical protein